MTPGRKSWGTGSRGHSVLHGWPCFPGRSLDILEQWFPNFRMHERCRRDSSRIGWQNFPSRHSGEGPAAVHGLPWAWGDDDRSGPAWRSAA